jgi:2-C-methyl-D-erythritol 4-phosphate cytidylyltransferase
MNSAILVAAGKSARMGAGVDKLFLKVAGRPVVAHTWQRFDEAECIGEIILVVREGRRRTFEELAVKYGFQKPFRIVTGGMERQDSVWNGLLALSVTAEVVAIHDAARPCVSDELITATVKRAAQPVTDTIKESADGRLIERTLDRSKLWAVQTPQTFRVDVIRRAISAARQQRLNFTDDTAACELIGQPVRLISRLSPNPKVTVPSDLPLIEALMKNV